MINYDDFSKVEIRIGEVKSVDLIEGADKLLRCMVDFGESDPEGNPVHRQILSGIREYIEDPQSLVGRRFPYVVNLEPRVIRGHESAGMILAAKHGEALALLEPTIPVPPGTKLS